jgi:hypothetical protein
MKRSWKYLQLLSLLPLLMAGLLAISLSPAMAQHGGGHAMDLIIGVIDRQIAVMTEEGDTEGEEFDELFMRPMIFDPLTGKFINDTGFEVKEGLFDSLRITQIAISPGLSAYSETGVLTFGEGGTGFWDMQSGSHDHFDFETLNMGKYRFTFRLTGSLNGQDYLPAEYTIHYSAVPEPGALAFLAGGAGVVAALLRRRLKS